MFTLCRKRGYAALRLLAGLGHDRAEVGAIDEVTIVQVDLVEDVVYSARVEGRRAPAVGGTDVPRSKAQDAATGAAEVIGAQAPIDLFSQKDSGTVSGTLFQICLFTSTDHK